MPSAPPMGHTRKGLLRRLRKAPVPVKAPSGLPVPPIVLWGAMFALLLALAAGSALRRRRAAERSTTDAGAPD